MMDTTPKYILMSEKALEDLAEFQPHIQYEEVPHGVNVIEIDYNGNWWFNRDNKILIPLFRQDQLQDMVKFKSVTHFDDVYIKIEKFYQYVNQVMSGKIDSMEQLWLGFVMKEKYGKLWNGKDWVKKD